MRQRNQESGFALLFIFAMAAAVALLWYAEMPRAVFESQRAKEDLLVYRGEQYQRAIQLYYRKMKKLPAKFEDLEKGNNIRFLRQKYIDPFTGKDEWRLVHMGPAGELVDSLVQKKKGPLDKDESETNRNNFIGEGYGVAGTNRPPGADENVNIALTRRPSDRVAQPGAAPDPNAPPGQAQPQLPWQVNPGQGQQYPQAPSVRPPVSGMQGVPSGGVSPIPGNSESGRGYSNNPNAPSSSVGGGGGMFASATPPPGAGQQQGRPPNFPQMPGMPGQPVNSQMGGQMQAPVPGAPAGPNNNQAMDMIRNLLTQPRPGGLQGVPQGGTGGVGGGMNMTAGGPGAAGFTGGIVGVASKYKSEGIKVINERTKIHEWEFLYDIKKDRTMGGGVAVPGQGQNPANPANPTSPTNSGSGSMFNRPQ